MKIYIDRIPDSGLDLAEAIQPAVLDLAREDIHFTDPINVTARASKGIGNVCVQIKITGTMRLNCSRCLEEFTSPLTKESTLNFPIGNEQMIDLTDNLREEIILEYPLKPLCRADCLGLCTVCGKNLNKGSCGCKPKP